MANVKIKGMTEYGMSQSCFHKCFSNKNASAQFSPSKDYVLCVEYCILENPKENVM